MPMERATECQNGYDDAGADADYNLDEGAETDKDDDDDDLKNDGPLVTTALLTVVMIDIISYNHHDFRIRSKSRC